MKNFLYFLLGIVISTAFVVSFAGAAAFPGTCTWINCGTVPKWGYNFGPDTVTVNTTGEVSFSNGPRVDYNGQTAHMVACYQYYYDPDSKIWINNRNLSSADMGLQVVVVGTVNVWSSNPGSEKPTTNNYVCPVVPKNCADADADGICDQCDPDSTDSAAAGKTYLKGYYEYNGQTVASIVSNSPSVQAYDRTKFHESNFPGFVLGLNMPSSIDENEFIRAGGKFVAFAEPELLYTVACPQVTDLETCGNIDCTYTSGSVSDNTAPGSEDSEAKATAEQKAADINKLLDNKSCDDRKTQCAGICGGLDRVNRYGCTGTGADVHSVCECKSPVVTPAEPGTTPAPTVPGGSYEYAPDKATSEQPVTMRDPNNLGDTLTENADNGDGGTHTGTSDGADGNITDTDGDGVADNYGGTGEGTINFKPLVTAVGTFSGKFPFSIIKDLTGFVNYIASAPQAPSFTFEILGHSVNIDLALFDPLATFLRSLLSVLLTVTAIWGLLAILS